MKIDGKTVSIGEYLTDINGAQWKITEATESYVTVKNDSVERMNLQQELLSGPFKRFGLGQPIILWPTPNEVGTYGLQAVISQIRPYIKEVYPS